MANDLRANLDANDPFKKLKKRLENKNSIHTPTISNPYLNTAPPQQATTEPTAPIKTDTPIITDTDEPRTNQEKKTKSSKTLHTFFIDEDLFFTLKALATYTKKPINNLVNTALANHLKDYDTDTINKARSIYTQIIELTKGNK